MTDVNYQNEPNPNSDYAAAPGAAPGAAAVPAGAASGLPLRGLAMVLIAVAVMLGLWALYSFTQGKDSAEDNAQTAVTSVQPAPGGQANPAATQPGQANPAAPRQGGEAIPGGQQPPAPGANTPGANGAPGAPAANPVNIKQVNVLNNSTIQGLASSTSQKLEADGYQVGEVGNFNEQILPATTVFFPAGNPAAEQEARELAQRFGGVARENIPGLPATPGLTLVLVSQ